ncbi:MAG: hypothetical protein LBU27_03165 [Candidatus Peribacteria bacterium]|jgi:hypothetical protein|nr:hypothetical protein [Candidatus Peribacteria bacterium]
MYHTAYEWAKRHGITPANTYETVRISDAIIRAEMAKIIATFATKLLQKIPDTEKFACTQFDDLHQANDDLQPYIVTSCQLGLMGMNGDGTGVQEEFFPARTITRAEVGTILSRLLRGTTYATQSSDETYYSRHLQALKNAGIIKVISQPEMLELRGNILLMLLTSRER